MTPTQRANIELHIAVFLFGFTAILGDLIQLSALLIVWWRVLLTSISLAFIIRIGHLFRTMPRRKILTFMGIGVIVAIHWVTFYGAIKLSNASIGVIAMATTSFFTSLLEPLILRQRVKWYELGLGLIIIPGMALIVNSTDLSMIAGLLFGLLSAFLAALFAILNKKFIAEADEKNITFLEMVSAWIFLSIVIPIYVLISGDQQTLLPGRLIDWVYLLALALICTTLAYILALRALHYISAFASNLAINLEPVYGILLAWLLLSENEELNPSFYAGAIIIVLAVFAYPLLKKRFNRPHDN